MTINRRSHSFNFNMPHFLELPHQHPRTESSPTPSLRSTASATSISGRSGQAYPAAPLQELDLPEEFTVIKTISEGCFSKLLLVRPRAQPKDRLALKFIHKEATSLEEFSRELYYTYYLSPHPNIITSFNLAFSWDNCYIFPQEYAPFADLSRHLRAPGLPEEKVKSIAAQVTAALEFIHSFGLVHRDVRVENVLVFRKDLSLVKLADFGHMVPSGSQIVKGKAEFTACSCTGSGAPPEVQEIVVQERYYTDPAEDVWSLGIFLLVCLTGEAPWTSADISDPAYSSWVDWMKRKNLKTPEPFISFTPRFLRLMKRILEPKPGKRSKVGEVLKYLGDEWLVQGRRPFTTGIERHESNATSKSAGKGGRRYSVKKRSTRSLKLDSELEAEEEPVKERVGKWILQSKSGTDLANASSQ